MKRIILIGVLWLAACSSAGGSGPQSAEIKNQSFTAPRDGAESAVVSIGVPFEKVFISALEESTNLINAEVEYIGDMTFDTSGETAKTVTLGEDIQNLTYRGDKPLRWNVQLNPELPLDLALDTASGEVSLDATGLNLSDLLLHLASGTISADVAATAEPITAQIDVSSGGVTLNLPDAAQMDLSRVMMGSGQVSINVGADADVRISGIAIASGTVVVDVPREAAVRLEVKSVSSGSLNLAFSLGRVSGTDPDEGVWETDGFADAEHQISIVVETIASGTFELR